MPTREIGRDRWQTFFDEFSQSRQGALVTIEVIENAQDAPDYEATRLPLTGISYDPKGSGAGHIEIMAGTEVGDNVTHVVTQPVHVYHKEGAGLISDEVNADEVLEITSSAHPPITYLRFQKPPS